MNPSGKSKLNEKKVKERERKEEREEWIIYLEQVLVFVSCIVTCQRETWSSVTHFIPCNASSNETLWFTLSLSILLIFYSLLSLIFHSSLFLLCWIVNKYNWSFSLCYPFFHRVKGVEISEWAKEHLRSQSDHTVSNFNSFLFFSPLSFSSLSLSIHSSFKQREREEKIKKKSLWNEHNLKFNTLGDIISHLSRMFVPGLRNSSKTW